MTSTPRHSSELQRARFATVSDFAELIAQEVYVDVDRLRFLAFHGIPDERDQALRSSVWKILLPKLAVHSFEPSSDPTSREEPATIPSSEVSKGIRDALDAYQPDEPFFSKPSIRSRMEKVCLQYAVEHPNSVASADPTTLVHLFGPFIFTCRRSDSEQLFFLFMEMFEKHNSFEVKERGFRRFMYIFRSQLPRLCAHFESEELDPRKWVLSWYSSLFARQLSLRCLLRLWDSYFSVREGGFDLHLYVCLAILKTFENDLLDKNYPEVRAFMGVLPVLDIERLVTQAQNFQALE